MSFGDIHIISAMWGTLELCSFIYIHGFHKLHQCHVKVFINETSGQSGIFMDGNLMTEELSP